MSTLINTNTNEPGATNVEVATDVIGSDAYQYAKLKDPTPGSTDPIGVAGFPLYVTGTTTPSGTQDTNIVSIGGNAVTTTIPVSGTVSAAQSGTWNINNVSGTVSLPTGASTSAKQPALGAAGSASTDVITIQGIASMTPIVVTATISGTGNVNVAQINGVTPLMGNGVTGTGSQRVTIASDNTAFSVNAAQSGTWNITNVSGTVSLPTGASTSALQTSGNTSLTAILVDTDVLVNAVQQRDTSAGGDYGVPSLFIRQDTPANGAGTDGYYDYPQMSNGRIWTSTIVTAGTVSVSSSALPTGASTSAKQPALGTAGTASSDVLTVQGIASMTPLLVTATSSGTGAVNLTQLAGNAVSVGNGGTGTGVLRVAQVSDGTGKLASVDTITNAVTVIGGAASGASKSGNPVQIGGVFNTTQPTVTNGQAVEAQSTARGAQIVATGADTFTVTVGAMPSNSSVNIAQIAGSTVSAAATGVQKVGVVGNAGATVDSTVGAGTAPTNAIVSGAIYNSTEISPTTGQAFAVQADSKGRIRHVIMDAAGNTRGANVNASSQLSVSVDAVSATNISTNIAQIGGTTIVNGGVAGSQSIGGTVATNVAITANPINLGAQAVSSENAAVTTARQVQLVADLVGKLIVLPYANPENFVSGAITSAMTGTTSTSLVAAPAAGLRNYITTFIVSNSSAAIGTDIIIQDGSGGTTLATIPSAAGYGGAVITLPTPLRQPTTATALFCANVTTGSSTKVTAIGYKGA